MGQTMVSGQLIDGSGKAVENVSVSYRKPGGAAILGFGRTNREGKFSLSVMVADTDSIQLDFNHLSYVKKTVVVANRTAEHTYTLRTGAQEIEEVKVAQMPIFRRKDTINYSVDAFTSKEDRVIADIIKRLPGIEMDGDRILYQGKPIQKYMVNNLDLMEGRYSMINKNLPADAVKNVQIVENDQPIKVLDSVEFSDRASLNLELKRFTHTGTGTAGLGISPFLWNLNLTPMTFGSTFQMLNSFQTNNIGVDVSRQLRAFYTGGGMMGTRTENREGPSFLQIQNVSSPGFDERKWLDNRIFLLSHNSLRKLDSGTELKANASYFNDRRRRSGFTATDIFVPDRHILMTESVANAYRIRDLNAGLLVEKNEDKVYLRNSLRFHKRWNDDTGNLTFNGTEDILQRRSYDDYSILNSLNLARFIGKQLVSITSDTEYGRTPQQLSVMPGQLADALNNGESYDRMRQAVDYRSFGTRNSLGFSRAVRRLRLSPSLHLNYQRNGLETGIYTLADGQENRLGDGYWNDMSISRFEAGVNLGFQYEKGRLKLNGRLPYTHNVFDVEQQGLQSLRNHQRGQYAPSARLKYTLNGRNEFSASTSYANQFGGMENFYNAYIINSYRSMQRYSARLLETRSFRSSVNYNYRNVLKARFANAGYEYSNDLLDYIFRSNVNGQGQTELSVEDRFSRSESHRLHGGINHFFVGVKTVVKLNGSLGMGWAEYLVNDVMGIRRNRSINGTLEIMNSKWEVLTFSYRTTAGYLHARLIGDMTNTMVFNNHFLDLNIFICSRHNISLGNSYYGNNNVGQRHQYFLDAKYRYTIPKWRTDVELIAQNLFNNSRYTQQFSSDYQLVETYFDLRPRQVLISTSFRF